MIGTLEYRGRATCKRVRCNRAAALIASFAIYRIADGPARRRFIDVALLVAAVAVLVRGCGVAAQSLSESDPGVGVKALF